MAGKAVILEGDRRISITKRRKIQPIINQDGIMSPENSRAPRTQAVQSKNIGLPVIALVAAMIAWGGCGTKNEEKQGAPPESPSISQGAHGSPASAGGVSWTVPERWQPQGERPMRIATYTIPAAAGDAAGAECAVFHFGAGQGGDVASNIDRWVGQFENPSEPQKSAIEVNGMKITTVSTNGTFLAPSGPMMQSQGKMENYSLLGAIVEAPEGSVFFKMTGPANTVRAASGEFDAMLRSLK
jgi:hypothetical protein